MTNEIATRQTTVPISFDQMLQQADLFVKSGFFPKHVDTKEKACVIMMKGRELGLPFTEALSKISVINGQPCTKVETLLGLAQSRNLIEDMQIKESANSCEVMIKRRGQSPYTCRFGDDEAAAMGLTGKDNYKKQKGTMYRWRAIAKALRVTCPDAIGGLYLEEEIADDVVIRPATEEQPAEVSEIIEKHYEATKPEENKTVDNAPVPDDQLGNWVMPLGKWKGLRLIDIWAKTTAAGKAEGREYLEWCSENIKAEEIKDKCLRFVRIMLEVPEIQY